MTSAARPTWNTAKGHEDQGGSRIFGTRQSYSSKDAPAHTVLKARQAGQNDAADVARRDLKAELLSREAKHYVDKPGLFGAQGQGGPPQQRIAGVRTTTEDAIAVPGVVHEDLAATAELRALDADADEDFADSDEDTAGRGGASGSAGAAGGIAGAAAGGLGSEDDDSDDSDDSDDDEAELLAELERIKRERAEEAARREASSGGGHDAATADASLVGGNPLLDLPGGAGDAGAGGFRIARRWDDDVVFRNQTRTEPKRQKRFVNDTIRSVFHRRFLNKYMK